MRELNVPVTAIDSYLYWKNNDGTTDELADIVKRTYRPKEVTIAGTALHKALERAEPGEYKELSARGFTFQFEPEVPIEIPSYPIRELTFKRHVELAPFLIHLVGKIDGAYAGSLRDTISDHKSTKRFDAERLIEGYQWRNYLWLSGASTFKWHVYEIKRAETARRCVKKWCDDDEPPVDFLVDDLRTYKVTGYHELVQHTYDGISADCKDALREYAEVATGMLDQIEREQEQAEVTDDDQG